jgi:zeaxanthin epoxidase
MALSSRQAVHVAVTLLSLSTLSSSFKPQSLGGWRRPRATASASAATSPSPSSSAGAGAPRVAPLCAATLDGSTSAPSGTTKVSAENPLRVVIAGAGVGGLALANAFAHVPHVETTVLEKTSQFKRFGGPIQLASNAMQTLREMDPHMYDRIEGKATFTGNLTNGIKDGIRDEWYSLFDLKSPAEERGMPFTCVVERPDLQEIMLGNLPEGVVQNAAGVASYQEGATGADPVVVTLEDGTAVAADVLIGADGIWSSVRSTMHANPTKGEGSGATYSGYTVYAGELDYAAPDNGEVGYKVYIGPQQYFVITDIGKGRYQWYAFLAKPVDTATTEASLKPSEASSDGCAAGNPAYLRSVFDGWSNDIHDIIRATRDDEIEQRDLYDRPPALTKPWTEGRVALLGDAIHAMMPNLGQGGCQAIEDAAVLAEELSALEDKSLEHVDGALQAYKSRRLVRSASVQGLSRFASDIIIRGFDTPAKVVDGRLENFNYAGVVTRLLQPILPVFFWVQFTFLYDGYKNEVGTKQVASGLGIAAVGSLFLLAFAAVAADAGLLIAFGVESAAALLDGFGVDAVLETIQGVSDSGVL